MGNVAIVSSGMIIVDQVAAIEAAAMIVETAVGETIQTASGLIDQTDRIALDVAIVRTELIVPTKWNDQIVRIVPAAAEIDRTRNICFLYSKCPDERLSPFAMCRRSCSVGNTLLHTVEASRPAEG